jgi:hypothetical protein
LRRQYASAVPGAAGDQDGFKLHETSLEKINVLRRLF